MNTSSPEGGFVTGHTRFESREHPRCSLLNAVTTDSRRALFRFVR